MSSVRLEQSKSRLAPGSCGRGAFDTPVVAGAPKPFAFSDETALRRFAIDAGLAPVEVFDVDSPLVYPDEATATRGLNATASRPWRTQVSRP